jgi:AraC family transcriptional regulator
MGGWLPGSGWQPDDRPRFEIYLNDPLTDPEGLIEVDICLAVKPM